MLADFQNSFTVTFFRKFAIKQSLFIKYPTSPQTCRYTILWNANVKKLALGLSSVWYTACDIIVSSLYWHFCLFSLFSFVLGRMLVVVFNPLCPVWFSLLLYCIYFCFSVPNKTISISISFRCDAAVLLKDEPSRIQSPVMITLLQISSRMRYWNNF